jgi:gluconolactonase
MDASIDALISADASIEIIAEGHDWTEGPLWVESEKMLLYSDIPPIKFLNGQKRKVRNYI